MYIQNALRDLDALRSQFHLQTPLPTVVPPLPFGANVPVGLVEADVPVVVRANVNVYVGLDDPLNDPENNELEE